MSVHLPTRAFQFGVSICQIEFSLISLGTKISGEVAKDWVGI